MRFFTFFASAIRFYLIAIQPVGQVALTGSTSLREDGGLGGNACQLSSNTVYLGVARSSVIQGGIHTLTAMMYAIVAKVVIPARISARNVAVGISLG